MIRLEENEISGLPQISIEIDDGEFAGNKYLAEISICSNPVCMCSTVNLIINYSETGNGEGADFELIFDVNERVILKNEGDDICHNQQRLEEDIECKLTDEDWELLTTLYVSHKLLCTEIVSVDDIDAEFPKDINDNDYLVGIKEILPYSRVFFISIDENNYFVDELYCVQPKCGCTHVLLSFMHKDEIEPRIANFTNIYLNYKKKTWSLENTEGVMVHSPAELINTFFESELDWKVLIENHHTILKKLYRNFKKKKNLYLSNMEKREIAPGRNDPCPCGSGKKYKKCCM